MSSTPHTEKAIDDRKDLFLSEDPLLRTAAKELFIGLVGPLGCDLQAVYSQLQVSLSKMGYNTIDIKLSDGLGEIPNLGVQLEKSPEDERIKTHMKAGTAFRNKLKRGDALALMAAARIRQEREKYFASKNEPVAYILRSLKHRDEVDALRRIYGELFFLISVYLPREMRVEYLAQKIAKSHNDSNVENYRSRAEELIQIDLKEEETSYGQDVGGAFPLADFFMDAHSRKKADEDIYRFIEILFGHPFHTPTKDEFGMYMARASALRSADLSRQVGAAIMTLDGSIISSGCNEVPKFGGGAYWPEDKEDNRDFRLGYDSSTKAKTDLIIELLGRLQCEEFLHEKYLNIMPVELAKLLDEKKVLKDTQAMNLLEFGRMVHAEMSAITDASRRGVSLQSTTLYCTTFPCHMCARHIIASGIGRVVYIEPYPKSKAASLYKDSIVVDPANHIDDRLRFEPFVGIAPRSYIRLFDMTKRKDPKDMEGKIVQWEPLVSEARFSIIKPNYIPLEGLCIGFIAGQIKRHGLS